MQGETPKRRRRIQAADPAMEPSLTEAPSAQEEQPVLHEQTTAQGGQTPQPDAQPRRRRRADMPTRPDEAENGQTPTSHGPTQRPWATLNTDPTQQPWATQSADPTQQPWATQSEKPTQRTWSAKSARPAGKPRTAQHAHAIHLPSGAKRAGARMIKGVQTATSALGEKCLREFKGRTAADRRRTQPVRQDPVMIEPVRPNAYHGNAQRYRQREDARRKNQREWAYRLACVLLVAVALFSVIQIGSIVVRSIRTKLLNAELAQMRGSFSEETEETATDELTPVDFVVMTPEPEMPDSLPEAAASAGEAAETYVPADDGTAAAATPLPAQQEEQPSPAPTQALPVVKHTKYQQISGTPLSHMEKLYEQNRDLVAWIKIPDILDLPVVYKDNSYYLTRDFYKQKNVSGTIFLDEHHPFRERTQNLLLHGHNMKDGTMFGHLTRYLADDTYVINHPFIYFDTLWRAEQYVIFAVLNVSLDVKSDRFFNFFTHNTFSSDEEFKSYIRQLQLRSEFAIPLDVEPGDALLTLSTCLDDDRLVIVARRLREGETRSEVRSIIRTTTRQ